MRGTATKACARVRLRMGERVQTFEVGRKAVVIGKAADCGLRIPLPFLADRHLVLDCATSVLRAKTCHDDAHASVAGRRLGRQWTVLPATAEIVIEGGPEPLRIQVERDERWVGATVLDDAPAKVATDDDFSVQLVTADDHFETMTHSPLPVMAESAHPVKVRSGGTGRMQKIAIGAGVLVLFLIVAAIVWDQVRRSGRRETFAHETAMVQEQIERAEGLIRDKDYPAAAAALEGAKATASRRPEMANLEDRIRAIQKLPAIALGARGHEQIGGEWYPGEVAKAWKEARERDDPKILAAWETAKTASNERRWEDGRIACEEAIALMDAMPIKPHPNIEPIKALRTTCSNQIVAAEMTGKGLVLFGDKWMTPGEKFAIQQHDRGLVEYRGEWMSEADAFAAQQTDRGLVLFDGKWLTPEQKLTAQGYVEFEGAWIKPEQKAAIQQERATASRQAAIRQRALAEQQQAELKRKQEEATRVAHLQETAYQMSQVFIKRQLKAPATAQFQEYVSDEVLVVYSDGWYLVRAPVDAQNGFGAMIRNTYLCKLRPIGNGDRWECELATLLD